MPIGDPNDKYRLFGDAYAVDRYEPLHVPIVRALQGAGQWLQDLIPSVSAQSVPAPPKFRWEVLVRYFSLGGQSSWATAKTPKSPAAPLTKAQICSWISNDLSGVQVKIPTSSGSYFITPDLDSWIAVVAWSLDLSYPVAQYGPGQTWQVLNSMSCPPGQSTVGECSSGQCRPGARRVGVGPDMPSSAFDVLHYRVEQHNPGIAGGWVPVTGWLLSPQLCAHVDALKDRYRPTRSEAEPSSPTVPSPAWGPTTRIVRAKDDFKISTLVKGPAALKYITCEGL